MKKRELFLAFVAVLLLLCFTVPFDGANAVSPDQPGPYHIGSYKVWYLVPPYGLYRATIRYPATHDGWRAPIDTSGAPYPGIVVANGFAGSDWNIKWLPQHLTSYGYVTICFTPPHKISWDATQWATGFGGSTRCGCRITVVFHRSSVPLTMGRGARSVFPWAAQDASKQRGRLALRLMPRSL
jgi:predicted dienelactone hydrolase